MLTKVRGTSCANRKACSSSHSDTKPLSGGKPRHRERADEREPGDPRHAMDQAAQAPEIALAG